MARLLSQLAVGETVTIQETGGGAQYYVGQHNYWSRANGNGYTMLIRAKYLDVLLNNSWDSTSGRYKFSSQYNQSYVYLNNTFFNTLPESIRNKISTSVSYLDSYNQSRYTSQWRRRTNQKIWSPSYFDMSGYTDMIENTSDFSTSSGDGNTSIYWYSAYGRPTKCSESVCSLIYSSIAAQMGTSFTFASHGGGYMLWRSTQNSIPLQCGDSDGMNWDIDSTVVHPWPMFCILATEVRVSDSGELYVGPDTVSFSNIPQIAMIGESTTIQWQSVSDATSYTLERSNNGGSSYTQVYTGANTTFTETVGSDWTQLQYRVKAINADGESPYTVSPAIEVVSSQVLVISGTDSDLGTLTADIHYTVSSNTGNQINLSRYVNGIQVASLTVDSGFSYDIPVLELPTGENQSIQIQASVNTTGGSPVSASRNWTYDKANIEFPDDAGIGVLSQNGDNVYPATVMEAIRTYGFMGGTLDKTLLELANSGQVLTGSYVGTGQYGASNPNTIELMSTPRLFFVTSDDNYGFTWFYNSTKGNYISGGNNYQTVTVSENTISWYASSALVQANENGKVYNWTAIC